VRIEDPSRGMPGGGTTSGMALQRRPPHRSGGIVARTSPGKRKGRSSAESDAVEHPFKHGEERGGIGGILTRARPGKQCAIPNRDYGDPYASTELKSEAARGLICAGRGAPGGAIEEAGIIGRGDGHQRRRVPVHGYLGHIRVLDAVDGELL